MAALNIPNPIADGQDVLGTPLAENFEAIKAFVNASTLHADGAIPMAGNLQLSDGNNAASTVYVDDAVDDAVPLGTIVQFAGSAAPNAKWSLTRGAAVSRSTYAALFALIGTTYGAGNGSTTFNLPNFQGRVPVGLDSGDSSFDALNEKGGQKDAINVTHTHTMPSHKHSVNPASRLASWAKQLYEYAWPRADTGYGTPANTNWVVTDNASAMTAPSVDIPATDTTTVDPGNTNSSGASGSNKNLQPYIVVNYLIKVA